MSIDGTVTLDDEDVIAGTISWAGQGILSAGTFHGPRDSHLVLDVVAAETSFGSGPPDAPAVVAGSRHDNWIRSGFGDDTIDGGGGHNIVAYSQAAEQYTVTTNGSVITIEDRSGHDGTDALTHIQKIEFQDSTLDTTLLIEAAMLSQHQLGELTELYVGYFDRAPDALGLDYWASRMVDGMSLAQISKSFFVQPETSATYPAGTTTEAFVAQVYQNVLGREPDQAGLAYWIADLESGALTRDVFVPAIINGAKSATGATADALYLANKEVVGVHFAIDKGLGDIEWGKQVMAHVDGTAESVAAANQMTDAFAHQAATSDPHLLLPLVGVHSDTIAN